jgi:hypothetical protein
VRNNNFTIEELSAYLDGELTPQDRERIEELVRTDPAARAELDKLRSATTLFASLPNLSAPNSLRSSIAETIQNRRKRSFLGRITEYFSQTTMFNPAVYVSAATLLVIVVGLYVTSSLPRPGGEMQFADAGIHAEEPVADDEFFDEEKSKTIRAEKRRAQSDIPLAASPSITEDSLADAGAEVTMEESEADLALAEERASFVEVSGPMYRAEILQTYYEPGTDTVDFAAADSEQDYVIQWGREMVFNPSSPSGTNENPLVQDSNRLPPEMPGFEFYANYNEEPASVLVEGVVHVARDGRVLFYRLTGPPETKDILDSFAMNLRDHNLRALQRNSQPVSVLYRFIAMLYPSEYCAE